MATNPPLKGLFPNYEILRVRWRGALFKTTVANSCY